MTMAQEDSDSEDEVVAAASSAAAAASAAAVAKAGCSAAQSPRLTTKVLAKEERLLPPKVEPDLLHTAAKAASTSKAFAAPAFPFLLTGGQQQPGLSTHRKDGPAASASAVRTAAARLMKNNVSTSNAAMLSMAVGADSSVLASMGSSSSLLSGAGQEGLLASLMSSKNAIMSAAAASYSSPSLVNLLNSRECDGEPVYKKPRKQESFKPTASVSDNGSIGQQQSFSTFSKVNSAAAGTSGFTHNPAMAAGGVPRLLSGSAGSHNSSNCGPKDTNNSRPSTSAADAMAASSVRLAGLPGLSLTAVGSMPRHPPAVAAGRLSGLMPPPAIASSSVTLSPVPRTSLNSDSCGKGVSVQAATNVSAAASSHPPSLLLQSSAETSDRKLFPVQISSSNTGNNSSSSSSNFETAPGKLPAAMASKSTMLINPVTGQFEAGPSGGESSSEGEGEHLGNSIRKMSSSSSSSSSPDSEPDFGGSPLLDYPGSTAAKAARATSLAAVAAVSGGGGGGEPSLKLKLKVTHSNSSKCVVSGGAGGPSGQSHLKLGGGAAETPPNEPKVPKIKIKLKDKIVRLEETGGSSSATPGLGAMSVVMQHAPPTSGNNHHPLGGAVSEAGPTVLSPVHLDLKTKVKIRPLAGEAGSSLHLKKENDHHHHHPSTTSSSLGTSSSVVSGQYRNLTLGHIVLDTDRKVNTERKMNRKGGGGTTAALGGSLAKEKKVKDRLAIWTESLAKHGQREEGTVSSGSSSSTATSNVSKAVLPRLFVGTASLVATAAVPGSAGTFGKIDGMSDKGEVRPSVMCRTY